MPSKTKKQDREEVKKEEVLEPKIITTSKEVETLEENSLTIETIKLSPNEANIVLQKQEEKEVYYITPSDIEQFLKNKELFPDNIKDIREKVHRSLQNLKRAWVEFGASLIIVRHFKLFKFLKKKYKTFASYCEEELKLKKSTIYEIIDSTLFLIQKSPEIYNSIMSGEANVAQLPSYHSIYLLAQNKKKIEKKQFSELESEVMNGELSSKGLQDKIREIKKNSQSIKPLAKESIINNYKKWYKKLEQYYFSEEIKEKAKELKGLLEKVPSDILKK